MTQITNPSEDVVKPRTGLYLISRISAFGDNPQCDGAFKIKIVDTRCVVEEWAIEIDDIPSFIDKHGTCVLSRDSSGFLKAEIYDGYRE